MIELTEFCSKIFILHKCFQVNCIVSGSFLSVFWLECFEGQCPQAVDRVFEEISLCISTIIFITTPFENFQPL